MLYVLQCSLAICAPRSRARCEGKQAGRPGCFVGHYGGEAWENALNTSIVSEYFARRPMVPSIRLDGAWRPAGWSQAPGRQYTALREGSPTENPTSPRVYVSTDLKGFG